MSEDVLGALFDQSVAGIYILDLDGRIVYVNARFAELFCATRAEMIGHSYFDFVPDAEVEARRAGFVRLARGEVLSRQVVGAFNARDGEALELLTQSTLASYEGVPAIVGVATDVTARQRVERAVEALRAAEKRSREHATRLEVLWKIANNPRLSGDEQIRAMLDEASNAIRPGLPYGGALFRVASDNEIVVEAVSETPEYAATGRGVGGLHAGLRIPVPGTAIEQVLPYGNGTHSWEDMQAAFATERVRAVGWRSAIVTTFASGGSTYLLWFASTIQTGPWEVQDHAYVEVVASYFASQAQIRWQFDQIRYHQTHDVLTGVLNRSQFRSQSRMASIASQSYAVIVLDVNGFSQINEAYGNMIGDALLVEVAAGLSERTAVGEIAGRLGGDVFAVFIPDPGSFEVVRARAAHFAERFGDPFSIGDRDGKEFITLGASIGMAMAPHHGQTVDAIISHAGVALAATKANGRGAMAFYEPGMD